jgi:hypothetical protein
MFDKKVTIPTHNIEGHKLPKKSLSQREKDLKDIIGTIDKVRSRAQKKMAEIQKELNKFQ